MLQILFSSLMLYYYTVLFVVVVYDFMYIYITLQKHSSSDKTMQREVLPKGLISYIFVGHTWIISISKTTNVVEWLYTYKQNRDNIQTYSSNVASSHIMIIFLSSRRMAKLFWYDRQIYQYFSFSNRIFRITHTHIRLTVFR